MSSSINTAILESNLQNKLQTGYVEDESVLLQKGAHHNPLDRNFDGKVNLQDLKPNAGLNQGLGYNQGLGLNQGAHHNPLDRNFDGKVDARDFTGQPGMLNQQGLAYNQGLNQQGLAYNQGLGMNQTTYVQSGQRSSIGLVRAQPTVLETIQKDVVIQERIHPIQKEEIQPIIYREREQLDVKQVTQMLHETQIQPTIVQQRQLPAERREAIVERGAAIQENIVLATREVDSVQRTQVVHAPIVNEIIKKTIIEEIQPVLERDIIQSTVIQNTQPIYEKIVEAPMVYRETIVTSQERGIVGGSLEALEAQGFNLGATGKRLSRGYANAPVGLNQGLAHNPLDRNFDGKVDARDFAGQPGMLNQGLGYNQGLASETMLTSTGLKRRSLVEALPASYSYLNQGLGMNQGLDAKIAEEQMLAGQSAGLNSALPAKTVL